MPANKPMETDSMITMLRILFRHIFLHAIIKIIFFYFYFFIAVTGFNLMTLYKGYDDSNIPMIRTTMP